MRKFENGPFSEIWLARSQKFGPKSIPFPDASVSILTRSRKKPILITTQLPRVSIYCLYNNLADFSKKISFFGHLVVLDVPQSPYLDCSPTSNYGIGSNWPYQLVFDTLYHSLEVNGGSRDPFWWLIGPKISFLGHLVVLDGLQSLLFHCWATSYVDIGLKWPYKSDYDTQNQR